MTTTENAVCIGKVLGSDGPEILYQVNRANTQAFFSLFRLINVSIETVVVNVFLKVSGAVIPLIKQNFEFKGGYMMDVLEDGQELNMPSTDFQVGISISKAQTVTCVLSGKEITKI